MARVGANQSGRRRPRSVKRPLAKSSAEAQTGVATFIAARATRVIRAVVPSNNSRRSQRPTKPVGPLMRIRGFEAGRPALTRLLGLTSELVLISYFMRVVERSFSDFLRRPNEVTAELAHTDVVLRRRNAPPLRLSTEPRTEARADATRAVAKMLRSLAAHSPAAMIDAVEEAFPWSSFLPDADRHTFIRELTQTLAASADLDNFASVAQLLREWRATAEIFADPELAKALRRSITANGEPVIRPGD